MNDREAMARAIRLAWRGWGRVGANPLVGALVIKDGAVVGEGWHAEFGGPHAEVAALAAAGAHARGADMVVSLEPCAHHGKTPPCADAIARSGIRRVVFGAEDVDERARGGARALEQSGVRTEGGLLFADVQAQNAAFFHRHAVPDRPFTALKLAVSLDGRIADRSRRSQWISGEQARAFGHWLRAGFDAIGVGLGTVRADNPQLTARGEVTPLLAPLRVVFDERAELPQDAILARTAGELPTLVLAGPRADSRRVECLRSLSVEVAQADGLARQLAQLRQRGVTSLLVEGGASLAGRLVTQGLVDRIYLITAPLALGSDGIPAFDMPGPPLASAPRWRVVGRKALGGDSLTVLDR